MHFSIGYKMKLVLVLTVNLQRSSTPDSYAICSCWQASTHQRHLSEVVWIPMRRASLLAQEKSGYCARSPCELIMIETSLGSSSSRTGKTTDSARLLISPACLFICQGKKSTMSFRHPVSQWWIINNVQRHWKYVEVYSVGPAGALLGGLGPLVNVGAPEICQDDTLWGNLPYVLTIVLQINTAAAGTHTAFLLI